MKISVSMELLIFCSMIAMGVAQGLVFDIFRILRKSICKGIAAVSISDVIYWIFAAALFAVTVLYFTDGALRGYMFVGIALGLVFYFLLLSKPIIFVFMKIIQLFLKIFKLIFKILLTPLAFLYKMLLEPFLGLIKKVLSKLKSKILGFKNFFCVRKSRKKNDKKTK